MMNKSRSTLAVTLLMISAVVLCRTPAAVSVTCNPTELSSCAQAILSSVTPSATCCAKLKQQQPCFCLYEKNYPNLKGYINSKNSKKVSDFCKVPIPSCH